MMLKKLIGWLAELYPNTVFVSKRFGLDLEPTLGEGHDPHQRTGDTALLAVVIQASRHVGPGQRLVAEFDAVTDRGRAVGDYRITVERLDAGILPSREHRG